MQWRRGLDGPDIFVNMDRNVRSSRPLGVNYLEALLKDAILDPEYACCRGKSE